MSFHLFALLALLITTAGALSVYLASPHQQLLPVNGRRVLLRWLGAVLVVVGGWCWRDRVGFDTPAAIFVTLTLVMLAWVALPYGDAGLRILRANRPRQGADRS